MVDIYSDKYSELFLNSPYTWDGRQVPRVTEILSAMLHDEYLMNWAEKMGSLHKDRGEILKTAADKGTVVHEACENFLRYRILPDFDLLDESSAFKRHCKNAFNCFLKWISNINDNYLWRPIMIEQQLVTEYFGGTLDALLEIGGKVYIIDFKTSNEISYKYLLQLAAYRYALKTLFGIEVDGCCILRFDKYHTNSYPEEIMIDLSVPQMLDFMNQCQDTFMSLVSAYYNRLFIEDVYKNITGKSRIYGSNV